MQPNINATQPNHLATLLPLWLWITGQRANTLMVDRHLPHWPIELPNGATDQSAHAVAPKNEQGVIDDQTALTIEHLLATQLTNLSHNLAKAREVQRGFMPRTLPVIAGLDLVSDLRPAAEVGGDFYDFIVNSRGELFFSVGDVSSKGVSAALLTPVIAKLMRTGIRFLENVTPQSLLAYIHDDLYHELTNIVMFTTMFIGHYHPATRTVLYSNAGHAPVIYRPAHESARLIHADGPPVGLLDQNSWCNCKLTLNPGDLLLIGTDGITDARNRQGTMFGYERLLALVDRLADQPATTIADELFIALHHFAPSRHHDDDQTLVLFKGS